MKTIWKFPLKCTPVQVILIPCACNAKNQILHFEAQRDIPCVWAMVDTQYEKKSVRIVLKETRHSCEDVLRENYIGTCLLSNGEYVLHAFAD